MPKISIVIPVYNSEEHLSGCLDSVVGQTLDDIEIICVDDASTDGSLAVLQRFADRDPRVHILHHDRNLTASQARKDGVLSSTGEYILFLDADDTLEPDACEKLYKLVQADPVDILHFGTVITSNTDLPVDRIRWMDEFVRPYGGTLQGDAIVEGAFSEGRLYNFSLWDKLYSADLCRTAFSHIRDGRFPRAEDKYAYFVLSYFAQTYRGVPDLPLYHYHFGRGSTGHNLLSLAQFHGYCSMALVADAIKEFLTDKDALYKYEALYLNARRELLQDCVGNWGRHLAAQDQAAGFDMMLEYWEASEVVGKIAELNRGDHGRIAELLERSNSSHLPKISLVIPVCNSQDYLVGCLDSVIGQTLDSIEVLCIDDASNDGSLGILREYAKRDPRVRVISYPENRSASQARKDGVLASTGRYIMFLDADDTIEPDTCDRLYSAMQADPVDMLHFGADITAETNLSPARIRWMREFVRPYDGTLQGNAILEGGFSENRLYNFTLWDKLYSATLCRKSFARVKDGLFPKAQDKYAFFILSYFARTYRGVPDEVFYHYHFGRGVTGHNLLSMPRFERYCSMGLVADAIQEFLLEEGSLQQHAELYGNVRGQLLQDCVGNWNSHLAAADKAVGFDLMLEYWDSAEVIAKIAGLNWTEQGHIARLLSESVSIRLAPSATHVVGTYYHRISNGGTQRILAVLIQLWVDLGYRVVLFTDLPPSPDDYDLPEGVERVVLPSYFDLNRNTYGDRALVLETAIRDHGIDVMVYHAWVSSILLWDLLVCKAAGAAFISHCHSAFSQPARNTRTYFADMPAIYHLCDAVIALSDVNRAYWENFNKNTVCVVNPMPFELDDVELSPLESKNVLWLGRMSDEKRPHEAIRIFRRVLDEEPEAQLHMVGTGLTEQYMDGLYDLMGELGIRNSVTMHGFHKDVMSFYSQASVFLMTSEFEGFPTVLSESQAAGVPCVMYELPYLTLTQAQKGFIGVELGDVNAAADAIVRLLADADYRRTMGKDARENIEALAEFDFAGTWSRVFDALSRPRVERPTDETARIMWETLMDHYRTGAVRTHREIGKLKNQLAVAAKKNAKAKKELQRVRGTWSFRIGYAVTSIPRKIRKSLDRTRADRT